MIPENQLGLQPPRSLVVVRAVTEGALGRAGIGTSDSAKLTLTAQVLCFWMD